MTRAMPHLTVEIVPDCTLKPGSSFAQRASQVVQIITGGDTKPANEVLGGALEVTVVVHGLFVFGTAEVRVGGDGCCSLEAL